MDIYGCDFSGAKNPEGKIFVTRGKLTGNELSIEEVISCEDRLDLLHLIKKTSAPWGLDFPFAIPKHHLQSHYSSSWTTFIQEAYSDTREQFKSRFGIVHSGKSDIDLRETDIAVNGKSPISATPIAMNGMLYGGRKLLFNLQNDVSIYPFTPYKREGSHLYEVYPSHLWKTLHLKSSDVATFDNLNSSFKTQIDESFNLSITPEAIQGTLNANGEPNLHGMDSIMACIVMAYCIFKYDIDNNWEVRPLFATAQEWNHLSQEGLILRVN